MQRLVKASLEAQSLKDVEQRKVDMALLQSLEEQKVHNISLLEDLNPDFNVRQCKYEPPIPKKKNVKKKQQKKGYQGMKNGQVKVNRTILQAN